MNETARFGKNDKYRINIYSVLTKLVNINSQI